MNNFEQVKQKALERMRTLTPESYEEYYLQHQEAGLDWSDEDVEVEEYENRN